MGRLTLLLVSAIAVSSVVAGPAGSRSQCSRQCNTSEFFKYQTGSTYIYDYEGTTFSQLLTSEGEASTLSVVAKAHITPLTSCDWVLTLSDVLLKDSEQNEDFVSAVTKHPLKFGFHEGQITEVCGQNEDPTWVVNFKKGILSTFQSTYFDYKTHPEIIEEEDISGVCSTEYKITEDGNTHRITKTKNSNSCNRKPLHGTDLMAQVSYNHRSFLQHLPLSSRKQTCNQEITDGVMNKVECTEVLYFKPYSNHGSVSEMKTTLVLNSVTKETPVKDFNFERTALLFVFDEKDNNKTPKIETIMENLKTAIEKDIRPEVPTLFSQLVEEMKFLTFEEISELLTKTKGTRSYKFIVDAAPLVGTPAAMKVSVKLIESHELTQKETSNWFTSLALLKKPTLEMFSAIYPALKIEESKEALLGVTSMINTYCKTEEMCGEKTEIQAILRIIESKLGTACRSITEEERIKTLVVLKALENAGHFVNAGSTLKRCYSEDNHMEIRVAALNAFKNVPCTYDRKHLLDAYNDVHLDSELRIAAYLSLMSCPTEELINTMKERLTSEGVNQVGSFVWTHLTNLQESAAPEKQWVRKLIGEDLLQKKFKTEALKFSRNYESSFYMNETKIGAIVESNVIFSEKSFLPKTTTFNFDVDLFGETINLLEFGGRIEGFEAFVESFFGPNGYYPEETFAEILKTLRQNKPAQETTLEEILDTISDEPEATYYYKMLGGELNFEHMHGYDMFTRKSNSGFMDMIVEMARKGNVNYSKSKKLIDTDAIIPTITGFPLLLSVEATGTVGLHINGDFRFKNLNNIDIEGHVHPSTAVDLHATMVVDAFVTKKGLKMSSNLHSSTYFDGKIKVKGGKLIDVKFNMPTEKIEILDFKTDLYQVDGAKVDKIEMETVENHFCTNQLARPLGVVACVKTLIPESSCTGSYSFNVFLEKEDTHTGYNFYYEALPNGIIINFDTPESKVNRKFELQMTGSPKDLDINIVSPFKSAKGKGSLNFDKNSKQMKCSIIVDDSNKYEVNYRSMKTGDYDVYEMEQNIKIDSPMGELLYIDGRVLVNKPINKYETMLELRNAYFSPIKIEGSTQRKTQGRELSLHLESGLLDFTVAGHQKMDMNKYSHDATLSFTPFNGPESYFEHSFDIDREINENKSKYNYNTMFKASKDSKNLVELRGIMELYKNMFETYNTLKVMDSEFTMKKIVKKEFLDDGVKFIVKIDNKLGKLGTFIEDMSMVISKKEFSYNSKTTCKFFGQDIQFQWTHDNIINGHIYQSTREDSLFKIDIVTLKDGYNFKVEEVNEWAYEVLFYNRSGPKKFDVGATFTKTGSSEQKYELTVFAEPNEANVQYKSNDYFVNAKATTTSLLFNTNIKKNINIEANVDVISPEKKVQLMASYEDKKVNVVGILAAKKIFAEFSLGNIQYSLSGEIMDNSVDFKLQYDSTKTITVHLESVIGNPTSLEATVETPFLGWEKNTAKFQFKATESELLAQLSLFWKNSEHISLVLNGVYNDIKNIDLTATLGSSIEGFNDRAVIKINTDIKNDAFNLELNAEYKDKVINGKINYVPSANGADMSVSFVSPFTQPFMATLKHTKEGLNMESRLQIDIVKEVFLATLNTEINNMKDINSNIKIRGVNIPEIFGTMKFKIGTEGGIANLEGNIDEKKISLSTEWNKKSIDNEIIYSSKVRFLTPLTIPFTLSAGLSTINNNEFSFNFDMTRFWAHNGNLKGHLEGKIESKNSAKLSGMIVSPVVRSSIDLKHQLTGNALNSKMTINLNGEDITVSAIGNLDSTNYIGDLKVGVSSSVKEINEFKINFIHNKEGKTRTSKLTLKKGDTIMVIDHSLIFEEITNFVNILTINQIYKMETEVDYYRSNTNEGKFINVITYNNKKIQLNIHEIRDQHKRTVSLILPSYDPIELVTLRKKDMLTADLTYSQDKHVRLVIDLSKPREFFATLFTPYFDEVAIGARKNENMIEMVRVKYGNFVDAILEFLITSTKGNTHFHIASKYMKRPADISLFYDLSSMSKTMKLVLINEEKHEGTLKVNTEANKYGGSLEINSPLKEILFSIKSDFSGQRYSLKTNLKIDNHVFKFGGLLNDNILKINGDVDGKKGDLTAKWTIEPMIGKVEINFNSPTDLIEDITFKTEYDFNEKHAELSTTMGSFNFELVGKLEDKTGTINGKSTMSGWKTFEANVALSEKTVTLKLARENRIIEVKGEADVKHSEGEVKLMIKSPYEGYETLESKLTYLLTKPKTNIHLTFTHAGTPTEFIFNANTENIKKSEFNFKITTPFDAVKMINTEATIDLISEIKKIQVKSEVNGKTFTWEMLLNNENPMNVSLSSKITSPVDGFKTVEIKAIYDNTKKPLTLGFSMEKEGKIEEFLAKASLINNDFNLDLTTPIKNWETIKISGSVEKNNDELMLKSTLKKSSEEIQLSGNVKLNNLLPRFEIDLKTPFTDFSTIYALFQMNLGKEVNTLKTELNIENKKNFLLIKSNNESRKKSSIEVTASLPSTEFGDIKFNGMYNFLDDVKMIKMSVKHNGEETHFSTNVKVNDNAIEIVANTSLDGFEKIVLKGDYSKKNLKHSGFGSITINEGIKYKFEGLLNMKNKLVELSLISPIQNVENIKLFGKIKENKIDFVVETSKQQYKFSVEYDLSMGTEGTFIKIKTPMKSFKTFSIGGKYVIFKNLNGGTVECFIQKNSQKVVMKADGDFTPLKSKLNFEAESLKDNKKIGFNLSYDLITEKKSAEVIVIMNDVIKTIAIEGRYNYNSGLIKIETPFHGFKNAGVEYSFKLNKSQRTIDAALSIKRNSDNFDFKLSGDIGENHINVVFKTPFEELNLISIKGKMDFGNKNGKMIIDIGKLRFSADVSYELNNMSCLIVTPYAAYKEIFAKAKYIWSSSKKTAEIAIGHNDTKYGLQFVFNLNAKTSEITMKGNTPFSKMSKIAFSTKYDFNNKDELLKVELALNDFMYMVKLGGDISDKIAFGKFDLTSPIEGLTHLSLYGKIDLTNEDKVLEITLEKEDDKKAIHMTGKLLGGAMDFSLKSPIYGLENFKTFANFSRSKRSVTLGMMNDAASASIAANFNSLHLVVKTPYEKAKEVIIDITRSDNGAMEFHWKRNQYYVDFKMSPEGKKKEVSLELKSEIPGWEFLALIGKLNPEEISAHISGQRNSEIMSVKGTGKLAKKTGNIVIEAHTPFPDYKDVHIEYKRNANQRSMSLQAKSSSSPFKIDIKLMKGVKADIFIPRPDKPTQINIDLALYKGHINIESRFNAIKKFDFDYQINMGPETTASAKVVLNGMKHFDLTFKSSGNNAHLKIEAERTGHKSAFHYHREGYSKLMGHFERDGKEFKVDVNGSGNLPQAGHVDIEIYNSFRSTPKTVKVKVDLDRTSKPKKLKVEVQSSTKGLYIFDLKYNADLSKKKSGDFELHITTPDKKSARWKDVSGSWDVQNGGKTKFTLNVSGTEYNAEGTFGMKKTDISLKSTNPMVDDIHVQYHFQKKGSKRDYYINIGRTSSYFLLKLKGDIKSISNANIEAGFRLPRVMRDEFSTNAKWSKASDGTVTGEGDFSYDKYKGKHTLEKFHRDAATHSADFSFKMSSNIPSFNNFHLKGNYNFDHKAVLHVEAKWDSDKVGIDLKIQDINPMFSDNTATVTLPKGQKLEISFGHDFRNKMSKSAHARVKLGARQTHLEAKWERNSSFTVLNGFVKVHSDLLQSDIEIAFDYDVQNFNDAHAEIKYKRNADKNVSLKFERKKTDSSVNTQIYFESHFTRVPRARFYFNADYKKNISVDSGLVVGSKQIALKMNASKSHITAQVQTPFKGFEQMDADLDYSITGKKEKSVKFEYKRGNREIHFDMNLSIPNKKAGSLNMQLTTPIKELKNLSLKGEWKNKKASVKYNRNGIEYSFEGKADVKTTQSQFDIVFTPANGDPIHIKFEYDISDFMAKKLNEKRPLAQLDLELLGKKILFEVFGLRNQEFFAVKLHAETNLEKLNKLEIEVESKKTSNGREVEFEAHVNEFHLEGDFTFETRPNGYYVKCKLDSTLTPLPGVIFGFGREGDERILTIGYGDVKEITISFKGKNGFKDGFSGKVQLPARGLTDISYDVDYKFLSSDELELHMNINYGDGRELNAKAVYNSDGVKARLTSPFGSHSLRARRSISDKEFMADIGVDDYSVTLQGKYDDGKQRGLILTGQVFGNPVKFDALFYSEQGKYYEGKLILETPIVTNNKIGGLFVYSNKDKQINGQLELNIPSPVAPKIIANFDFNTKDKIEGELSLNAFNQLYAMKINAENSIGKIGNMKLEIITPYHVIGKVSVEGKLKFVKKSEVYVDLTLEHPYGINNIMFKFNRSSKKFTLEAAFDSSYHSIHHDMIITKTRIPNGHSLELTINKKTMVMEFVCKDKQFNLKVDNSWDTPILYHFKNIDLKINYALVTDMNADLLVKFGDHTHEFGAGLTLKDNEINGNLLVQSDLLQTPRKVSFKIISPNKSFQKFEVQGAFESSSKHSILVQFEHGPTTKVFAAAESSLLAKKIEFQVLVKDNTINIITETQNGKSELILDSNYGYANGLIIGDYITFKLNSLPLNINYEFVVKTKMTGENKKFEITFNNGTNTSIFVMDLKTLIKSGSIDIAVEIPVFRVEKFNFVSNYDLKNKIKVDSSLFFLGKTHDFFFMIDKINKSFETSLNTSIMNLGFVKAEAGIKGNKLNDSSMHMKLMRDNDIVAANLLINMISDNKLIELLINTPIAKYQTMKFIAEYNKGDINKFVIRGDYPLSFKLNGEFSNKDSLFHTKVDLETNNPDWKKLTGVISLPLDKFAPKINLVMNDTHYGIESEYYHRDFTRFLKTDFMIGQDSFVMATSFRNKAPYELNMKFANKYHAHKFNLRTDSSVLNALLM